jgi:hypothetical protein
MADNGAAEEAAEIWAAEDPDWLTMYTTFYMYQN